MILVDTDLWIDFFSGADPGASVVEKLLRERRAMLSVISVFELFCGARKEHQRNQLDSLLRVVPIIDLTREAAVHAAGHYKRLRNAGSPIGNQDLLLTGTALEYQLPILSRNRKHFERIAGLDVVSPEQLLSEPLS